MAFVSIVVIVPSDLQCYAAELAVKHFVQEAHEEDIIPHKLAAARGNDRNFLARRLFARA